MVRPLGIKPSQPKGNGFTGRSVSLTVYERILVFLNGLEPSRDFSQRGLNPLRLPIPPQEHNGAGR